MVRFFETDKSVVAGGTIANHGRCNADRPRGIYPDFLVGRKLRQSEVFRVKRTLSVDEKIAVVRLKLRSYSFLEQFAT